MRGEGKSSQEEGKQVQLCSRELGMGIGTSVKISSELRHRVHLTLQSTHTLACVGLACVPNHTHYWHKYELHGIGCDHHDNRKEEFIKPWQWL